MHKKCELCSQRHRGSEGISYGSSGCIARRLQNGKTKGQVIDKQIKELSDQLAKTLTLNFEDVETRLLRLTYTIGKLKGYITGKWQEDLENETVALPCEPLTPEQLWRMVGKPVIRNHVEKDEEFFKWVIVDHIDMSSEQIHLSDQDSAVPFKEIGKSEFFYYDMPGKEHEND